MQFTALPTKVVEGYRRGAPDAYGNTPERRVSDGGGVPCRHCLADVAAGEEYLILAYRPFSELQPYAETGPIFIHASACERYATMGTAPPSYLERATMMIRGYDRDERTVYGTGAVVPTSELTTRLSETLARPDVSFVDIRSALNGCYQCRVWRAN